MIITIVKALPVIAGTFAYIGPVARDKWKAARDSVIPSDGEESVTTTSGDAARSFDFAQDDGC
jgi:hypothetical protein